MLSTLSTKQDPGLPRTRLTCHYLPLIVAILALFALSPIASAEDFSTHNFEVSGGYAYSSGNQGLNGFNVSLAYFFAHRVALVGGYDGLYDTSQIGTFQLTPLGLIVSKSHLQNYLIGPRVYFPGLIKSKEKHIAYLLPFAEAQFGTSHLDTEIQNKSLGTSVGTNDSAFTWMLGGGADYRISPHWVGRINVDFLRTHLADAGQSRLRLGLGVAYTFGKR
jgi:opacity protein-like surface antigen